MIRTLKYTLLATGLLLAISHHVNAQTQTRIVATNHIATKWSLVRRPDVQKDLHMSAEKAKQVLELVEVALSEMKYYHPEGGITAGEDIHAGVMRHMADVDRRYAKQFLALVTPQVDRRLDELEIQLGPISVLGRQDVVKKLGLTTAQQAEIEKLTDGFHKHLLEIRGSEPESQRGGPVKLGSEHEKQLSAINKKIREEFLSKLRPEQLKTWHELIGAPVGSGSHSK